MMFADAFKTVLSDLILHNKQQRNSRFEYKTGRLNDTYNVLKALKSNFCFSILTHHSYLILIKYLPKYDSYCKGQHLLLMEKGLIYILVVFLSLLGNEQQYGI